jgi:hypothetical protein
LLGSQAAALAATDVPAGARAYARARHLFEHATGASSRRITIEAPGPIGWTGTSALWSAKLRGAAPDHQYLLVAETSPGSTALTPSVALDLGKSFEATPIPWNRQGGGALLSSPKGNALWSAPWLEAATLPAGKAKLAGNGSRVAIVRGDDLEIFDTSGGARTAAFPKLKASGDGAFAGPDVYAEVGVAERALVVDVAKGQIVVDEPETVAGAVSPSGKLVALLLLGPARKPSTLPRVSLAWVDGAAPSKPRTLVDIADASGGVMLLAFDEDRGAAVLVGQISAMGQEGSTDLVAYVPSGSKTPAKTPSGFEVPDRSVAFARIAKLAAPGLKAPRVAIEQWLHSETVAEDRASGRAVIVTGIAIREGLPSHVGKPSLMFIDTANKKLVRDVPLAAEDLTIVGLSIAPGGRSALVSPHEGPSFLVDADSGDILPGSFPSESPNWSPDGQQLLWETGVVNLHAKGARALVEVELPLADPKKPTQSTLCLIGTQLAPAEVCRATR